MSPFCGQLSDKSQLAFEVDMVVRGMKRNRDRKSNAERFLTVQRTASQQLRYRREQLQPMGYRRLHWDSTGTRVHFARGPRPGSWIR